MRFIFCRATHIHNAVYAVCPSVYLYVTLVYCVKTTELIVKQLALDCNLGGVELS